MTDDITDDGAQLPDGQKLEQVSFYIGDRDKADLESLFDSFDVQDWQGFIAELIDRQFNQQQNTTSSISENKQQDVGEVLNALPAPAVSATAAQKKKKPKSNVWLIVLVVVFLVVVVGGVWYFGREKEESDSVGEKPIIAKKKSIPAPTQDERPEKIVEVAPDSLPDVIELL